MAIQPQSFANHARYDPPFHFFVLPVVVISALLAVYHLFRSFNFASVWLLLMTIAAMIATFKVRFYALGVQDRVVRLEERLRMLSVLEEPLRSRVGELTDTQLIGLRFAPDAELPLLVQRALDEKLGCTDIKKAVTNWRPDHSRI